MKKIVPAKALLIPDYAKKVFKGVIFDIYQWPQRLFDGSEATFEMLKRPDTVVAICVVEDKIIVVDDEQPHDGLKQGFPGGQVDESDASITEAAKREVKEETGYSFKNWKLIQVKQPYNKIEWFVHIFIAWDVETTDKAKNDPGEKISVNLVTLDQLRQKMIDAVGYLGEDRDLFAGISQTTDLVQLKDYSGQLIDR